VLVLTLVFRSALILSCRLEVAALLRQQRCERSPVLGGRSRLALPDVALGGAPDPFHPLLNSGNGLEEALVGYSPWSSGSRAASASPGGRLSVLSVSGLSVSGPWFGSVDASADEGVWLAVA
jgi:hypothetical protein